MGTIVIVAVIVFFIGAIWGAGIMSLLCVGEARPVPKVQGERRRDKVNSNG